jgi:hypothetical protein
MSTVNAFRYFDSILPSNRFDLHTPSIVDMASNHSDSPSWRDWYIHIPQFAWKILEEKFGHSVIGSPSGE